MLAADKEALPGQRSQVAVHMYNWDFSPLLSAFIVGLSVRILQTSEKVILKRSIVVERDKRYLVFTELLKRHIEPIKEVLQPITCSNCEQ